MSDRPTPETDANAYSATTLAMARLVPSVVHADFARRLERRLADAMECVAALTAERDELRRDLDQACAEIDHCCEKIRRIGADEEESE